MFGKRHDEDEILRCSFCSKTQDQVDTLISNPSERSNRVCICNECVAVCNAVLEEHQKARAATPVEARLRASVLEEHERARAASTTVVGRLKGFAARP
jgi:ATP-dependent protease Clp ATPase subunit